MPPGALKRQAAVAAAKAAAASLRAATQAGKIARWAEERVAQIKHGYHPMYEVSSRTVRVGVQAAGLTHVGW